MNAREMDAGVSPIGRRRKTLKWLFQFYLYIGSLFILYQWLPDDLLDTDAEKLLLGLGIIGVWRWGWWLVHIVRSIVYLRFSYPKTAARAGSVWRSGWRPDEVVYMMTTYKEDREITHQVVQSVIDETRSMGVPGRLFVGTGDAYDEEVIEDYVKHIGLDIPLEIIFVRQKGTGKRMAIGTVLRELSRRGIDGDTPVVFMDGDTLLRPGCMEKCLPLFELDKRLDALTTNEDVIVWGPQWIQTWLDMRFGQRHLGMASHALSGKVITLTGRMSVFRGRHTVNPEFIEVIESDNLTNWLWGKFRFLSGDDKSTWYWLLKRGTTLTYVPDAMATTIEIIEGNGIDRMKANLLRWSGNMLRNGTRAIALGPRKVNPFIWWCLIDQRISIWTVMIGPILTILGMIFVSPYALLAYVIWILATRLVASIVIGFYAGKYNIAYPFILYFTQILNSAIKAYLWFRLPKQRWANRGNQSLSTTSDSLLAFRNHMAFYLTALSLVVMVYVLGVYMGKFEFLTWQKLQLIFG